VPETQRVARDGSSRTPAAEGCRHFAYSQSFFGKLAEAGGRIAAGTDTATRGVLPRFSLDREMELLARAGLSPMRAVQAATRTAADFLGLGGELGTIEAGKLAGLIIVEGQPHVRIGDVRKVRIVLKGGIAIRTSDVPSLSAGR
jgi:imidazolonepropionase-like amidohydrolase